MKSKKGILAVVSLAVAAAAALGGCKTKQDKEYEALNKMLDYDYSQVVLTVTNMIGEETSLVSEYKMDFVEGGMRVNYSIERFTELSLDSTGPAKTTLVGEAVVMYGEVYFVKGDKTSIDLIKEGVGLDFQKAYFENAEFTEGSLNADVTDPNKFMGLESHTISCTDMKVKATFEGFFYEIEITYQADNGNLVKYQYDFKV